MGWESLELKIKPEKILNSGIFTITLGYFCWGLRKGLETQERFPGDRATGKTLSFGGLASSHSPPNSGDFFGERRRNRRDPVHLTACAKSSDST